MKMEAIKWLELKGIKASCEEKTFLKAIEIWLQKPQVVNRRLAGAVILHRQRGDNTCSLQQTIIELVTRSEGDDDSNKFHSKVIPEDCTNVLCDGSLRLSDSDKTQERGIGDIGQDTNAARFEVCLRKLVPRQLGQGTTTMALKEIIIIDHEDCTATFVALLNDSSDTETRKTHDHSPSSVCCFGSYMFQTAYKISFSSKTLRISLHISDEYHEPQSPSHAITCPTKAWLQDCLLPKIVKWASEVSADTVVKSSQALVAMERYSALYAELKKKYGSKFVKIWPETTDPLKFVYEDVAIATYLLVLWEQEREEKSLESLQSFVDLGCGNGLLVHILNSEGHHGKGIDLRRRKIWDLYGPGTNLEECSITPSDEFLFADYDWLIGNHSDELTPWIPVMAARSCYTTRYFVLPCCFHDFDAKFIRSEQAKTQYRAYLDFVQEVGKVSGFRVQEDILRIPSTKRICQIGSRRNYPQEQTEELHTRITDFISGRRKLSAQNKDIKRTHKHLTVSEDENRIDHSDDATQPLQNDATNVQTSSDKDDSNHFTGQAFDHFSNDSRDTGPAKWAPEFQPREKNEPVRNCANVDNDLKKRITYEVAHAILSEGGGDSSDVSREAKDMKVWRRGGSLTLAEIAKLFNSDVLKQLKKECGGLKTLLKNSHQIFQVAGDKVVIRDWSTCNQDKPTLSKKRKYKADKMHFFKTSLCWFDANHPDGCPRLASDCQFAHGEEELKNLSIPSR